MTYPESLAREATNEVRHEYLRGDVWAMAGGTPTHARLCASLQLPAQRTYVSRAQKSRLHTTSAPNAGAVPAVASRHTSFDTWYSSRPACVFSPRDWLAPGWNE